MTRTKACVAAFAVDLILIVLLPLSVSAQATGTRKISSYVPDSWFSAPKTASQMGIKTFKQSPYLDALVKSGKLPPVAKRLPDDPVVTEVVDRIGKYGGRIQLQDWPVSSGRMEGLFSADPNASKVMPNAIEGYEYKNEGKTLILHLRHGLKWSDGVPFTSEDITFWWKYIVPDKELNPLYEGGPIIGKITNVTALGTYDAQIDFSTTDPFFIVEHQQLGGSDWWWAFQPAHYMKQFHPAFVDKAKLDQMVKDAGLDHWQQLFNKKRQWDSQDPTKEQPCPTLQEYVVKEQGTTYTLFSRNPYYWKVDPAGNQLPYIDEMYLDKPQSNDTVPLKTFAGEYDIGPIQATDVPAFQKNAVKADYRLLFLNGEGGADLMFYVNITSKDPVKKAIFSDARFRQALSLAIDRDTVNKVFWLGVAVPRQYTVISGSSAYDPKYAQAYAQFDPAQAGKLLDAMGLKMGGDGFRTAADGKALSFLLEAQDDNLSKPVQFVVEEWKKVGLNVTLKMSTRETMAQRGYANDLEMVAGALATSSDLSFARRTFLAPIENTEGSPWKAYEDWYLSGGKVGQVPPDSIKLLTQYFDVMSTTINDGVRLAMEKNLLASQAQNLWYIGVVGEAPTVMVVKNRVQNVPASGTYGWDSRYWQPFHPEQFYLTK